MINNNVVPFENKNKKKTKTRRILKWKGNSKRKNNENETPNQEGERKQFWKRSKKKIRGKGKTIPDSRQKQIKELNNNNELNILL